MREEYYSISNLSKVYSGEKNFSASEVAQAVLKYEKGLKYGCNEYQIKQEIIKNQIKPMEECFKKAWSDTRAQKIRELINCEKIDKWDNRKGRKSMWDILPQVMADAIAISSYNASMGRVVAAPTGGSCGILPATVFNMRSYLMQEGQITPEEKDEVTVDAMLVAAGIGLLIADKATLSGAEGGCQAECGAAAGMAAGAIITLKNGNVKEISNAAALALKNCLGLTCDPVKGYVLVPCIKRNAIYSVQAIISAEMAMIGIESTISLIQIIKVLNETGKSIPEEFRETAKGGLATTRDAEEKFGKLFDEKLEKILSEDSR